FAFVEVGAKGVVFADINEDDVLVVVKKSRKFAEHVSFKAITVKVDIIDKVSVNNMVQTAIKEFGRIDYNVNSAGINNLFDAMTPNIKADMFFRILDINVRGIMLSVRVVSKTMTA
ncbi:MAG: hypothetical protein ALECFALPRED_001614, partial [Alectoria fallacina]